VVGRFRKEAIVKKVFVKKLPKANFEGIDPLVAIILAGRGMKNPLEIKEYIFGGKELLHDPALLRGAKEACEQIEAIIKSNKQIIVYGDYDADGVCATAIMCLAISELGGKVNAKLPDRVTNGYGLTKEGIANMKKRRTAMIITVDNGITAIDEIAYANSLGIKVVITDHHQPGETLPVCEAIVNPNVEGETYPYPYLAGAGVAFKIVCLLYERAGFPKDYGHRFLDLAAIGTVADVVPLTGENRIIVKEGLKLMRSLTRPGIEKLFALFSTSVGMVTSGDIAFKLAPAINAAGRIIDNGSLKSLSLLVASEDKACHYANELFAANQERKALVESHLEKARESYDGSKVYVYCDSFVPEGIAGLIAGKLKEELLKPVIVLAEGLENFKGSGRSVQGFDMVKALRACSVHLKKYGGHPLAAGLSIEKDLACVDSFRKAINDYADEIGFEIGELESITVDAVLPQDKISLTLAQRLQVMEPFGEKNPKPMFLIKGFKTDGHLFLTDKKHVKFYGKTGGAIAFGMAAEYEALGKPGEIDLAATIGINTFNGKSDPQLEVVAFAKEAN